MIRFITDPELMDAYRADAELPPKIAASKSLYKALQGSPSEQDNAAAEILKRGIDDAQAELDDARCIIREGILT